MGENTHHHEADTGTGNGAARANAEETTIRRAETPRRWGSGRGGSLCPRVTEGTLFHSSIYWGEGRAQ